MAVTREEVMTYRSLCRAFVMVTVIAVALLTLAPAAWSRFPGIRFIPVSVGFTLPVHIANAGDGSGRLFVVEQGGTVRIISGGSALSVPFLDISAKVIRVGNEQGLLNITFPPQFVIKQYFYVNYTRVPDGATVIARYQVTANPNIADPASEEVLLVISQPFANHNGGMMTFGPDGFLYIGMGDGGSAGDPNNFAQNVNPLPGNQHLLGKLLRIDVESGFVPYAIPPTNPLFNGIQSEIWARGLRNPWKFSFDSLTGALYIGDVGQATREEINYRPASSKGKENFGWRMLEGTLCFNPAVGCVQPPRYVPPVTEYSHAVGCAVTGGYVYRGIEFPALNGIYFFGDFCSGIVWGLQRVGAGFERKQLIDTSFAISTFGEGEDGSVFVADRTLGNVFKIAPTVTVIFPDGGEVIPAGSQQTIRWNAAPGIRTFDVQFSLDNGLTWITVGQRVTGRSILWNVPPQAVTSATCLVRVIGFDAAGLRVGSDRSDKTFTITAGP
jgi:glucose/arabinose dehydrogenase